MKLPTSMCSGPIRHSPPERLSTPWIRRTFDSIPSICAPSETRKRQRSWMCGSQAAFPITVSPGVSDGRHDGVLGCHHARLVEEDVPAAKRPVQLVAGADVDLGAELGKGVDVRVEPAAADHVAARRRDARPAEAREQRAREQERGADTAGELRVELVRRDLRRLHANFVVARPLDLRADVGEQGHHRLGVADPRHVVEHHRLGRQQARGEDRQRAVLVAGRPHASAQGPAALDDERRGDGVGDGCLGHAELS